MTIIGEAGSQAGGYLSYEACVPEQDEIVGAFRESSLRGPQDIEEESERSITSSKFRSQKDAVVLSGHTKGIWRVRMLSPEKVVTASYDGTARIWDIFQRKVIETINFSQNLRGSNVLSIAVSENRLFIGSAQPKKDSCFGAIVSVDKYNLGDKKVISGIAQGVFCLTALNDEQVVVGSCKKPEYGEENWDYSVKIIDLARSQDAEKIKSKRLGRHQGEVPAVVLLGNTKLATCSVDKTIKIWDAGSSEKKLLGTLEGHTDTVYGLCKKRNSSNLFSGSKDQTLREWDTFAGTEVRKYEDESGVAHTGTIFDVCEVGSRCFASASKDRTVKLWDSRINGKPVRLFSTLNPENGYVYSVCAAGEGRERYIIAATSGVQSMNKRTEGGSLVKWDYRMN